MHIHVYRHILRHIYIYICMYAYFYLSIYIYVCNIYMFEYLHFTYSFKPCQKVSTEHVTPLLERLVERLRRPTGVRIAAQASPGRALRA